MLMEAAIAFVTLHGPGGQPIYVNPHEIVSARAPRPEQARQFAAGTACVIEMTDGGFIAVTEDCPTVLELERQGQ